jgi:hypothetical protein
VTVPSLPTGHLVSAALHVAAVIGDRARAQDAAESYWQRATGGVFAPDDLAAGEGLLIELGLLIKRDEILVPAPELTELLAGTSEDAVTALGVRSASRMVDAGLGREEIERQADALMADAQQREELLVALGRCFDDAERRRIGAIGEELVVSAARDELRALGRLDLARAVRRVSLLSDELGYDVSAPRIDGTVRRLEVKATVTKPEGETLRIYLSRNEADVGNRMAEWALVICAVEDLPRRPARILGWCGREQLEPHLPRDVDEGRWEQARVELAPAVLLPGLPSAAL